MDSAITWPEDTIMTNQPPIHKIKIGNISIDIWENKTKQNNQEITFQSVTLNKNIKDKEGNWKNVQSYGKNDLPKIVLGLQKAFEYMYLNKTETQTNDD